MKREIGCGSLLDVGSGTGAFLDAASRFGYDARGMEVSESGARISQRKHKANVINRSILELDPQKNDDQVKIVTAWDVIGHLDDPLLAIRNVNTMLGSGGRLLMTTPDPLSVDARKLRNKWYIFYPERIFYYFTKDALTKILVRNGFKIIRMITPGLPSYIFPFNIMPMNTIVQTFTLDIFNSGSSIFLDAIKE
jgi:2-polyprenyl-3-methyl-5-hydroxy-6-metoxy-1,4-benzoquinol methylase